MSADFFLDSNVILYSADSADPQRRDISKRLLTTTRPVPVISTQVLHETYVNARKKYQMTFADARHFIVQLSLIRVITIDSTLVLKAIDLTIRTSISYWDALIVAAAAEAGCGILYTEDLNAGQIIDGVRVVNPFKENIWP